MPLTEDTASTYSGVFPAGQESARPAPRRGVTVRAVLIGLVLIPLNTYWIIYVEGIRHWNHCTAMSLFWNTIFCLLILILINLLLKYSAGRLVRSRSAWLRRRAPWLPFTQGELITIYTMITLASALAGHDS